MASIQGLEQAETPSPLPVQWVQSSCWSSCCGHARSRRGRIFGPPFSLGIRVSVRASAPERQQESEISTIHNAIAVDVRTRECRAGWTPEGEQYAKVAAVDNSIQIEITVVTGYDFTDVGDAVDVVVG